MAKGYALPIVEFPHDGLCFSYQHVDMSFLSESSVYCDIQVLDLFAPWYVIVIYGARFGWSLLF